MVETRLTAANIGDDHVANTGDAVTLPE